MFMQKAWLLADSNIRKSKGQVISLMLLVMLAMTLLTLGMITFKDNSDNFYRRADELNAPDGILMMDKAVYSDEVYDDIKANVAVTDSEVVERTARADNVKFDYSDGNLASCAIFSVLNDGSFNKTYVVSRSEREYDNGIYLPIQFYNAGGYELDDTFTVAIDGKYELDYKVAGFFDNIYYGSQNVGCIGFLFDKNVFETFSKQTNHEYDVTSVMIRTSKRVLASDVLTDIFSKYVKDRTKDRAYRMHITAVKQGRTFMSNIIAMMIVAFSAIVLIAALLVIRFRIINIIEDNVKNIGALKAMGYVNSDIILSYILQFLIISFAGIVMSFPISAMIMPIISTSLEKQSGMIWNVNYHMGLIAILTVLMLMIISATVLLTARRVNKLHPIVALRGGIQNHNFKKNHFPLDRTHGALSFLLGMKNNLMNMRQNLMFGMIVAAVTFAGLFAYTLYYNMAVDNTRFVNAISGECPDVQIEIKDNKDDSFIDMLRSDKRVRKALYMKSIAINIEGTELSCDVSPEYKNFETNIIYKGRYPIHDNEIAVGGLFANEKGVQVGDEVVVECGNESQKFIVSGLTQRSNNMGYDAQITSKAAKRMLTDYQDTGFYCYMAEGADSEEFCTDIKEKYKGDVVEIANIAEILQAQLGAYINLTKLIIGIVFAISIVIITLILFLVIKTHIAKSKINYGILKATGYTTNQLILQTAISYIPSAVIGAGIGTIVSGILVNPTFSVFLHGIGVMNMSLIVKVLDFATIGLVIVGYIFAIALIISIRIRKLSPITLIRE